MLQRTHDEAASQVAAMRSSMVDVEHKLAELDKAVKDNSVKAKHWQKKTQALQLHV